uniref:ERCC1-like central domain-containing protein n=2 Tax=Caenorhabditis japonica TaxID=281687 RepID=A0A8R1DSW1_CAEJA
METQFPTSSSSSSTTDFKGVEGGGGGGGALVVNRRRQEGNPVLKYVRNVRYEWGDIGADFECGPSFGVVYLSFKYHKQHPDYVYSRINGKDENRYRNKVLLGYCNMEEPKHVLRELNMICFREAWTLVVVYTVEEAAEYIELFKTTQKKEVTIKKKPIDDRNDTPMSDERRQNREIAVGFLTSARSITKTDADSCMGREILNQRTIFDGMQNLERSAEAAQKAE